MFSKNTDNPLLKIIQNAEPIKETKANDILLDLMDSKHNIDLKTEIDNPKALSVIMLISKYLNRIKYHKSSLALQKWKEFYVNYMVSDKRKGRKEVVEVLKALAIYENQQESNEPINLMSNLAK
jgi:hypothetical protein